MHQASVYHVYTRVSFLVHSNNNAYIHERMNVCTSAGHLANFSFSFLPLFCYRILSLIAVTRRSFSSSPPLSRSFTIGRRTRLHEHFRNFPPWIFVPVARSLLPRAKHFYPRWFNHSRKLSVSFHANFTSIRTDILEFASKVCIHLNDAPFLKFKSKLLVDQIFDRYILFITSCF